MTLNDTKKIYHIYAKGECIYHSLCEEEFTKIWETLTKLVELIGNFSKDDIEYEELVCETVTQDVSYWQIINNIIKLIWNAKSYGKRIYN